MLNQTFYPTLRDLIRVDALPPSLGFLQSALGPMLDNFFYDNLVYDKSANGDSAFYSLDVILKEKVVLLSIPGTEIALVLNPPPVGGPQTGTVFKVNLQYRWEILRFIRGAKLNTFSFDVRGFLDLLSGILGITREQMTEELINVFIGDLANPPLGQDPLQDFVDNFNLSHSPAITAFTDLADVVNQISANHDILQLIIDDYLDDTFEKLKYLVSKWVGPLDEEGLKKMIIPYFLAAVDELAFGIELPRSVFIPVDNMNVQLPGNSMIRVSAGSFSVDSVKGFIFDKNLTFSFTRSEILNSGFILAINGLKLDFSEKVNIPEAVADGRPSDFRGVYIQDATLEFPAFWQHNDTASSGVLNARNLLAGTGGVSGVIALEAKTAGYPSPLIEAKFGAGFSVSLDAFSLEFQQSAIINSDIQGTMKIPGFKDAGGVNDAVIRIKIHIGQNGEFSVTASEADGIRIKVPGVFDIIVKSASIGRVGGRFFFALSGAIDFQDMGGAIGKFLPDQLEIQKLIIWDDGQIELEGGKITLPRAISLKIGPVALSVTAIGVGSHEQMHPNTLTNQPELRKYKYFVFDGGVNVNPGGVDVSGNGVAFYYTVDNDTIAGRGLHFFVRIQSIAIDITIPGSAKPADAALLLKGFLSMQAPENGGDGTEYVGGVEFTLPKLKMGGSAAMRMNPKVPAWIIDVGLELSTPIVLGSTGLGIYGFRGLVGQRYVATKNAVGLADDAPWWQYYKAKVPPTNAEGINVGKFEQTDGFSLGAGISLATVPDAGKTFSSKLFFLLSLPEVFLLQGQGQILKERIGLDTTTDPPFFALLAITSTSIEAAFGVNYKVPDDGPNAGKIATINALIEMGFFWGNAGAWYVNLGKDQPLDRRIQVRLLTLFDVYFYMMLSSSGIRAGAGASFEINKTFGPLKAELYAYMDVAGRISFKPKQIGGSIQIGGGVSLSIFGLGFSLSAAASLAAEAPKPFNVAGEIKACIRVFRKDYCAKFNFTWSFDNSLDLSEIKLLTETTADAAKAINMQTKESYAIYGSTSVPTPTQLEDYYIPADSFIDIEFVKGVLPSGQVQSKYGGNAMGSYYIDYVSPQRGKSDRVRHEYELVSVKLKYHDGSTWSDYDVYAAATPLALSPFVTTNLSTLPFGYWQYQTPNLHNKLRILGQSPLEYVSQGSGTLILEDSNITAEGIFCGGTPIAKTCTTFETLNPQLGTLNTEPLLPDGALFFHGQAMFQMIGGDGIVTERSWDGLTHAICFRSETDLQIDLIGPMVCVDVKLYASFSAATVTFFERQPLGTFDPSGLPLYDYVAVRNVIVAADTGMVVTYDDILRPIERILIESGPCPGDGYYYYSADAAPTSRTGINQVDGEQKIVFRSAEANTPSRKTAGYGNRLAGAKNKASSSAPGFFSSSSGPGCGITPEADQLVRFLNVVLTRGENTVPIFFIYPSDAGGYNGVYYNTVLYGTPGPLTNIEGYNNFIGDSWEIRIDIDKVPSCRITLSPPDGVTMSPADWLGVVRLDNPRCDEFEPTLGESYSYLADAYFIGAGGSLTMLTVTIQSCYAACDCPTDCGTYLYRICTLPYEAAAFNASLPSFPAVQNEIATMINAFQGSIRPIWRFDTTFLIEVATLDTLYRESGSSVLASFPKTYYFGFRTAGPPGHFHQYLDAGATTQTRTDYADLLAADRQDEFKLSKLLYYLDLGKSYPNVDGQLLDAKPLFYLQPKLNVFWTQPYVYEFFRDWDSYGGTLEDLRIELEALVKDPAPDPGGSPLSPVVASWVLNSLPTITQDIQILNNMIINGGNPCAPTATIMPLALNTEFVLPDLQPLKLYTTLLNAKFMRVTMGAPIVREVHRFGFQTSRYGNFTQQVQSYYMVDPSLPGSPSRAALFVVAQAFDAASQILVARDILDPADPLPIDDPLRQTFGHRFNRLTEGALQLPAMDPPLGTEVNVIQDTLSGHIIGLLVKNPEPFNDPKISLADIAQTVRLSVNGGPTGDYFAVHSRDYAQVFLTNADLSMHIPSGATVRIYFDYKQFNGASYVVASGSTLNILLP